MKRTLTFIMFPLFFVVFVFCGSQMDRAKHFNKLARAPEWKPDEVIKTLDIQKGDFIGDLGSGGGYYTFRFAEETGSEGKVFAADINQEFLKSIELDAKEKGISNIQTILAKTDDSNFEENSLDLIFIRNTFHHFDNKNQYIKKLAGKIKKDGRIAIIDYKKESSSGPFGHNITKEDVLESLKGNGLIIEKEYKFLEKQYFFILKKK
ncbi:MAG: class I SAM-dependent methyltransferase [Calditrichaeota bacterium]|nr:MAG: class I SAM-dependent methyltransferase [Calditrichota bacterium]MBL1204336.1 class I SAM-dependent methyltransferase [Calditrichota bacterium]NOG44165.1 class I SAM-dependent methyltransferase [Calditrichota bacterium]